MYSQYPSNKTIWNFCCPTCIASTVNLRYMERTIGTVNLRSTDMFVIKEPVTHGSW